MDEYKTSKIEFVLNYNRSDISRTSKNTKSIADSNSDTADISQKKNEKPTMQSLASRIMRVSELVIPDTMIKVLLAVPKIIGPVIAIFTTVVLGILANNAFGKLVSGWFTESKDGPTEITVGDDIAASLMKEDVSSNINAPDEFSTPAQETDIVANVKVTGDDIHSKIVDASSKEVTVNASYELDTSGVESAKSTLESLKLTDPLDKLTGAIVSSKSSESTVINSTLVPAYSNLSNALSDVINKMYILNTGKAAPTEATQIDPALVSSPVVNIKELIVANGNNQSFNTWNGLPPDEDPVSRVTSTHSTPE